MATKRPKIDVSFPEAMNLTPMERGTLEENFRTCVVQVLGASRPHDPAPFPEINISGVSRTSAQKSGSTKKAPSKGKKASSKAKKK